jgi:hypothetical protein
MSVGKLAANKRKRIFALARLWSDRTWDVQKVRILASLTGKEAEEAAIDAALKAIKASHPPTSRPDKIVGLVMIIPYRPLPGNFEFKAKD